MTGPIFARAGKPPAPKPKPKKSALRMVWRMLSRVADVRAFDSHRIAQLEERVAALDGGQTPAQARRSALSDLSTARAEAGAPLPLFRLIDDRMEWTGPL